MTPGPWRYPDEFRAALALFGLAPVDETQPSLVRDQLNDLYRFELRRLRSRLLAGSVARPQYLELVIALRKRYWPLTLPLPAWEKICGSG